MAGLSLRTGISTNSSAGSGNYAPLTPASALPSTARIADQAYGISGSGANTYNDNVAWVGSVSFGVVAMIALVYLWYSLPR
jgi:hypothetical protein